MLRISGYCLLIGAGFSPSRFASETGFCLRDKTEPGQIGMRGKYNGLPEPSGSAILDMPLVDNGSGEYSILPGVAQLLSQRKTLEKFGIEETNIHFDVEYIGQCNLELGTRLLTQLSSFGVPLSLTCYQADATDSAEPLDIVSATEP